jgi:hypothetical protein
LQEVKRKKKSLRVRLVEALDKAFNAWIIKRDAVLYPGCTLCGIKGVKLYCAHLISSSKYATRWHPGNAYSQCCGCNLRHEFHPQYYTAWWIKKHGEHAYHELVALSNVPPKHKTKDLEALIEMFK